MQQSTNIHSFSKKRPPFDVHSTRTRGRRRTTPWPPSVRWWTWSMRLPRPWWPPWMDLPWVAGATLGCWSWRSIFSSPNWVVFHGQSMLIYDDLLGFTDIRQGEKEMSSGQVTLNIGELGCLFRGWSSMFDFVSAYFSHHTKMRDLPKSKMPNVRHGHRVPTVPCATSML